MKTTARQSNRDRLLHKGLRVVHAQGFGGASVRDIVQAAGVPQGSFTNHFASKEAFGLEVLDLYLGYTREMLTSTLLDASLAPLQRIRAYIEANIALVKRDKMRNGCLYGNLSAEAGHQSDAIRLKVADVFAEIQSALEDCLRAAVEGGEIAADTEPAEMAGFVLSSLQGAILLAKAQRSAVPVERFETILFDNVLR